MAYSSNRVTKTQRAVKHLTWDQEEHRNATKRAIKTREKTRTAARNSKGLA